MLQHGGIVIIVKAPHLDASRVLLTLARQTARRKGRSQLSWAGSTVVRENRGCHLATRGQYGPRVLASVGHALGLSPQRGGVTALGGYGSFVGHLAAVASVLPKMAADITRMLCGAACEGLILWCGST